jgi:hypothetical protein
LPSSRMCRLKTRRLVPPKQWHLFTSLHGDTLNKMLNVIFMAIKTSNPKREFTWYTSTSLWTNNAHEEGNTI